MTDVIHAVNEADKNAGQIIDALGRLFPAIPSGSHRRALKRDIKAYEKERHLVAGLDIPETDKSIVLARLQRDLLHADNLAQIVQDAAPQIDKAAGLNDMDPDWIDDFTEKAGKISDKDMQRLWSRLLAGEANNHGTFSKKTMVTLYELDRDIAKTFNRYCTYAMQTDNRKSVFDNLFTPLSNWGASRNKDFILDVGQLKSIEDAGLITRQYNVKMTIPANLPIIGFLTNLSRIVFKNNENREQDIYFTVYPFTQVGDQLCSLCDWGTATNIEDIIKSLLPSPAVVASFIPKNLTGEFKVNSDGSFTQNTRYQNGKK